MGRHTKPSNSRSGVIAAIATTGAFAAVPLNQGVASAATVQPGIDWSPIIHCESGGNIHAHNPASSASGAFQFLRSTWVALGGKAFGATASDATLAQQQQIAERAYARSGLSPWAASRSCWSGKVSSGPQVEQAALHTSLPAKHKPRKHGSKQKTKQAPVPATPAPTDGYTVAVGDSLSSIAAAHGVTWQALWADNKAAIANPNVIHTGLHLNLGTSTGAPSSGDVPVAVSSGPDEHMSVQLTGYSFQDNQGDNNATISQGVIHKQAGGTGSFADPITVASPGSAGSTEEPKGTKFYSTKLKRYLIVEDSGATKESQVHLDVWVGGQGGSKSGTDSCESSFTGKSDVIKNPPSTLPVTVGPIFANGKCNV